jgi:Centromere protein H (CENP-H)
LWYSLSSLIDSRELLPRIHRRDLLSIAHTNLSSSLSNSSATLTNLETENILTSRRNVGLTKTLLDLVDEAKSQDKEYIQDQKSLSQLEVLEKELQFRRSRWRTMKNVVSAVIVGSGIDWVRDARLRQLVIDDEDEIS